MQYTVINKLDLLASSSIMCYVVNVWSHITERVHQSVPPYPGKWKKSSWRVKDDIMHEALCSCIATRVAAGRQGSKCKYKVQTEQSQWELGAKWISITVTPQPHTVTSEPPCCWITGVCQYPRSKVIVRQLK